MRSRDVSCLLALMMLSACSRAGTAPPSAEPTPAVVQIAAASTAGALVLGDWTTYAEPEGQGVEPEEIVPLDDDRWMRVSAELACAGRVERGDAGAQRAAAARVLQPAVDTPWEGNRGWSSPARFTPCSATPYLQP